MARPEPSTPRNPVEGQRGWLPPGTPPASGRQGAGYQIITQIPDMGSHFLNPAIQASTSQAPILVYACHGRAWQLVALE
jgi:hypothetical protein